MKRVLLLGMGILLSAGGLRSQSVSPDWTITSGYQYAMRFYGSVSDSFGSGITATNSLVAVLNQGVVVGLISMINGPAGATFSGAVYNNSTSDSGLTMLLFNGSDSSYSAITTPLTFSAGSSFGSIANPIALSASPVIQPEGGTLLVAGSMTYPSLGLTRDTVIDFSKSGSVLTFTGTQNSLGGQALKVYDWQAGDSVNFSEGSSSGLSQNTLLNIQFYSDAGMTFIGNGLLSGNSLMFVPVPEPGVWIPVLGMLVGLLRPVLLRKRTS